MAVGVVTAGRDSAILMGPLNGCHQTTRCTLHQEIALGDFGAALKPANTPFPIAATLTPGRGAMALGMDMWPAAWPCRAFHQAVPFSRSYVLVLLMGKFSDASRLKRF